MPRLDPDAMLVRPLPTLIAFAEQEHVDRTPFTTVSPTGRKRLIVYRPRLVTDRQQDGEIQALFITRTSYIERAYAYFEIWPEQLWHRHTRDRRSRYVDRRPRLTVPDIADLRALCYAINQWTPET